MIEFRRPLGNRPGDLDDPLPSQMFPDVGGDELRPLPPGCTKRNDFMSRDQTVAAEPIGGELQ